ncbi:uncharacterized protein LOC128265452 [Drosophila gunungcola]|uniref:uncharacterized protein LOC128265452 n=1 Tax=Drosophila gunungcola TaxID=103775 RepID=UPI0022DF19C7|nr:uncharacterized protein LOC128265452 [Drosophila gunungcola]
MSNYRRQEPQPFWNRLSHRYSQLLQHFQHGNPSWQHLLLLANLRKALVDFKSGEQLQAPVWTSKNQPIPSRRQKSLKKHPQSQKIIADTYQKSVPLKKFLPKKRIGNQKHYLAGQQSLYPSGERPQLDNIEMCSSNYNSSSDRLQELFKNRTRGKKSREKPWQLSKEMKLLKTNCLLRTKKSFKKLYDPYKISSSALHYKATPRIHYLARPQIRDQQEAPGMVPRKNQVRKRTTKRLRNLAKPKLCEDNGIRKKPFQVSGRALRAKITSRLQLLAKQKHKVNGNCQGLEDDLRAVQIFSNPCHLSLHGFCKDENKEQC